ncbi:MAG: CopG family transcriptional regulator [Pseudomonadota bacterium]
MHTATVRIDRESENILREMTEREHLSRGRIIQKALVIYRRKCFLNNCAEAYASLKSDSKAWKDEIIEREAWDSTGGDGLEKD